MNSRPVRLNHRKSCLEKHFKNAKMHYILASKLFKGVLLGPLCSLFAALKSVNISSMPTVSAAFSFVEVSWVVHGGDRILSLWTYSELT
jgi:hypothetical protein